MVHKEGIHTVNATSLLDLLKLSICFCIGLWLIVLG